MAKQFLDESSFTIKIGGIEIDPTTGSGADGLLKLSDWTVEKTPANDIARQEKQASIADAFGGTSISTGSNGNLIYNFPTSAESWGGFANETTDIYPVRFIGSFEDAGFVTFTASVPSGGSADAYFRFEKNPYPDTEPSVNSDTVTISGSTEKSYSVVIPSQGDKEFRSLLFYVVTRDVPVAIRDVIITANFTGGNTGNDLIFSYDGNEKLRIPSAGSLALGSDSAYSEYVFTASADQVEFSGTDNFGTTMRYPPGKIVVFMNGVRLMANVDFTATDGSSVDFTEPVNEDDIIMIQSL